MRDISRDPKIPISLIEKPEFVRACADHDMAQVFKLAQKYGGLSNLAISRMTSIKPDSVSLIMRGKRAVEDFEVYTRIADGLGIPGGMLGLAARPWERVTQSVIPEVTANTIDSIENGDDTVERRQFLSSGAGVAAGYMTSLLASEPREMNRLLNVNKETQARIGYFERTAEVLGTEVVRVPSPTLLESSLIAFRDARLLAMACNSEAERVRTVRANSMLATVIGLILFDSNRFDESREWYRTARHAASNVGDRYLSDIALASEAYVPTYSGDPTGVLSLLAPRLDSRATNTAAVAWQWAFCGKAHAVLGNKAQAERAFDQSERVLNEAPKETVRPGVFSFLPEKLAMYRAQAYVSLDLPEKAISAANQALASYDPHETTEPSLARFELASALLRAGEIDEACKQATKAVTDENVFMGISVRKSADRFSRELPKGNTAAAQEWKDVLWSVTV